jgi:calcium-dependent protein kinase
MGCSNSSTETKKEKEKGKISKYSGADIRKNFELIYMLGNGAFGKVRLYRDKNDKSLLYAIKTLKKKNIPYYEFKLIKTEVDILSELDHPNIVNYFGTFEDEFYIHIIMEYLKGDNLFKVISVKNYTGFDEQDMSNIIFQLVKALFFIHNKNIVHRDIKPENILFSEKKDFSSLKLIDFGLATQKKTDNKTVGTPYYMAPEMIKGKYSPKSDIWSVGIIIYLMLTDKFPFVNSKEYDVFEMIEEGKYNTQLLDDCECSEEAKDLVKKILVKDPDKRPSASDIMHHPWIKKHYKKRDSHLINRDTLGTLKEFAKKNALQKEIYYFLAKIHNEKEILQLKQLFNDFDTDNSGNLSMVEIRKGFKQLGIEINEKELEKIWEGLDFHKDGEVNYTEFLAAMISTYKFTKEENLWVVFNYLKENNSKNDYISIDNLINMCNSMNLLINEEEIRKNLDGYRPDRLDFDDFKKIMGIEEDD